MPKDQKSKRDADKKGTKYWRKSRKGLKKNFARMGGKFTKRAPEIFEENLSEKIENSGNFENFDQNSEKSSENFSEAQKNSGFFVPNLTSEAKTPQKHGGSPRSNHGEFKKLLPRAGGGVKRITNCTYCRLSFDFDVIYWHEEECESKI